MSPNELEKVLGNNANNQFIEALNTFCLYIWYNKVSPDSHLQSEPVLEGCPVRAILFKYIESHLPHFNHILRKDNAKSMDYSQVPA